jgi:hypothetical protein
LLFHCFRRTPIGGIIKVPARARTLFSFSLWLGHVTSLAVPAHTPAAHNGSWRGDPGQWGDKGRRLIRQQSLSCSCSLSLTLTLSAGQREQREEQAPGQIKTRALRVAPRIICLCAASFYASSALGRAYGLWPPGAHKTGRNHATRLNLDCI